MRFLVVEDDRLLADGLSRSLGKSGHAVDVVSDGAAADAALSAVAYDLVILDLQLPRLSGLDVLRRYRAAGGRTPVLILTARTAIEDRVGGLDAGADDYLAKPFDLSELEARVRSLVRRAHGSPAPQVRHGSLTLDTVARRASIDGTPLELSAREFAVLETLLLRAGQLVSKEVLLDRLYRSDEPAGENAVEVFVHRLRRKIEPAGVTVRTVRGLGYMIDRPQDG
ncbi:MAG TPA: response regulator [Burkholderiales bacterium]|nr:response regulator [Burkholderiales bacterium]